MAMSMVTAVMRDRMYTLLPAASSLLLPSRGYKKDMNKPKCVTGDLTKKIPEYYNFHEGIRESDPDALKRFYRLGWGGWIRPKCGRRKKLWKKGWDRRWWSRQHIILSDDQAAAMEAMIIPEHKKRRYFLNDPYEPYHKRHGFETLHKGQGDARGSSYITQMFEY